MRYEIKKVFHVATIAIILLLIALTYVPGSRDPFYESDDYVFLAQVTRHGLPEALFIPFHGHFFPLFRLVTGASHIMTGNAVLIRIIILGFHLATVYLVFRIVHTHTDHLMPALIASTTFGFSPQASKCVLWCVTGQFGIGLFFSLLMLLYLKKADAIFAVKDIKAVAKIPGANKEWFLSILFYMVALGFSILPMIAAFLALGFVYLRQFYHREENRSLRLFFVFSFPFLVVSLVYLGLRAYLNQKYLPEQDVVFLQAVSQPAYSLEQTLAVYRLIPVKFFLAAAEGMAPFFRQHAVIFLCIMLALIVRTMIYRRTEADIIIFLLIFSFVTLLIPLLGRVVYTTKIAGYPLFIIAPHYYVYSMAGISLMMGLLLWPPEILKKLSIPANLGAFILVVVLLFALNRGNAATIRSELTARMQQNRKFHEVVAQYETPMALFLLSEEYNREKEYYFEDGPVAEWPKYLSSWGVSRKILFDFLFPKVKNIHFISGAADTSALYQWKQRMVPFVGAVISKQNSAEEIQDN